MWIGHRKKDSEADVLSVGSSSERIDEGLKLETSASESFYGGQFTLSTQLIKPNYPLSVEANFIIVVSHAMDWPS